ncbi:hypothetical protein C0J50_19116 [Silurus asotus]|uniref:Uncharacterized protein n=1 Tax=Silurus asotus TaxID=30991 RepID=A0AAD5ARP0_SILAS|nr:hypothetical protein C0J50_19116 [Silurus asotus]
MASTFPRKSYPPVSDKSKSSVVEDSKKKSSLLKDNSWIKKDGSDDKPVEDIKTVKPPVPNKTTKNETFTVITSKDKIVQEEKKTVKTETAPSSPTKSTRTETVTVTTFKDSIVKEDSKTAKSVPPISPSKTTKTETITVDTMMGKIIQNDKSSGTSSTTYTSRSYKDDRAGDSLWLYQRTVHCEGCFGATRILGSFYMERKEKEGTEQHISI